MRSNPFTPLIQQNPNMLGSVLMRLMDQAHAYDRYFAALENGLDWLEGLEVPCSDCKGTWTVCGRHVGHERTCTFWSEREAMESNDRGVMEGTETLLPCPFCGAAPQPSFGGSLARIACSTTVLPAHFVEVVASSRELAIQAWNLRGRSN